MSHTAWYTLHTGILLRIGLPDSTVLSYMACQIASYCMFNVASLFASYRVLPPDNTEFGMHTGHASYRLGRDYRHTSLSFPDCDMTID